MPVYRTTLREGVSSEKQRAQISNEIVRVHCGVTGAPECFVNTYFSEVGPKGPEVGSGNIPKGNVAFIHATIRAGRTDADKAEIVSDLTAFVAKTLGCPPKEVTVVTEDIPAHWCMEGGVILPDPGSPEEEEWKKHE
jgi:phenylpyruvate tautomerase PptA (4-oxalocrotonate tautomerase family)